MGAKTGIEWTDATWNPIIGCSRVSEGCRNCYAEGIAGRFGQGKQTVYSGLTQIVNSRAVWTGKIVETRQLLQPLSWRKPKRVFVNSMSDLFHENVTDEQRDRIFAVMALCPQHTFQVLTKRPERMLTYLMAHSRCASVYNEAAPLSKDFQLMPEAMAHHRSSGAGWWPLANVWLGVSVENQAAADERIPVLLETPAAVRFISAEPLLGPVNLRGEEPTFFGSYLDWVICGGESGPHARPMHPEWARSLRDQCQAAHVPFFFKQWGEWAPLADHRGRGWKLGDPRTGFFAEEGLGCYEWHHMGVSSHGEHMLCVGKKAAGAVLDGREWKEFPVEA